MGLVPRRLSPVPDPAWCSLQMLDQDAPRDWERTTTAELIREGVLEIGDGYRAKNSEFVPAGGLPFVRVGDVGHLIETEGRDELPLSKRMTYEPKVSRLDDTLITMKGTVGRVARVLPSTAEFVYSPQISYWRVLDRSRLDPRFIGCWLRSPAFIRQAFATKGATDMADYINLRDQRSMRIVLPPIEVQKRIGSALGIIEELIEINELRNRRLRTARDLLLPRLLSGRLDLTLDGLDLRGLE
jgi:type I restriction enzyme S subunit